MSQLVLSLFPGIGLLDMAFEEEGFCVVRGPDLLWGGDIRRFHPPAGRFDGVIGGPPCKRWSALANINRARYGEECLADDLIPEYERVVREAEPDWFLMENVPQAPLPYILGYDFASIVFNNRWCGGEQNRVRRFSYGVSHGRGYEVTHPNTWLRAMRSQDVGLEVVDWSSTVTCSSGGRRREQVLGDDGRPVGNQAWTDGELHKWKLPDMLRLQGLPDAFLADAPFTDRGKREVIGNGVPLPMGRAVARAVKRAIGLAQEVA